MKKKFLFINYFIFLFFVNLYANNINDFQIESISLGEDASKYFSKMEIESKKKRGFIYPKKDFYSVTFYKTENPQFETYDAIQLHLKSNDKDYKIYSIGGRKYFDNDYDGCVKKLNLILPEIENTFKGSKTYDAGTEIWKNTEGYEVKTKSYWIRLPSGDEIAVECYDQPKEMNIIDGLNISIDSKEFSLWLSK